MKKSPANEIAGDFLISPKDERDDRCGNDL